MNRSLDSRLLKSSSDSHSSSSKGLHHETLVKTEKTPTKPRNPTIVRPFESTSTPPVIAINSGLKREESSILDDRKSENGAGEPQKTFSVWQPMKLTNNEPSNSKSSSSSFNPCITTGQPPTLPMSLSTFNPFEPIHLSHSVPPHSQPLAVITTSTTATTCSSPVSYPPTVVSSSLVFGSNLIPTSTPPYLSVVSPATSLSATASTTPTSVISGSRIPSNGPPSTLQTQAQTTLTSSTILHQPFLTVSTAVTLPISTNTYSCSTSCNTSTTVSSTSSISNNKKLKVNSAVIHDNDSFNKNGDIGPVCKKIKLEPNDEIGSIPVPVVDIVPISRLDKEEKRLKQLKDSGMLTCEAEEVLLEEAQYASKIITFVYAHKPKVPLDTSHDVSFNDH